MATHLQIMSNNITVTNSWKAYGVPDMATHGNGHIHIGDRFRFNSGKHFNVIGRNQTLTFQVWGKLTIGNHVRMSGTSIICKKAVTIGDDVMIGGNVVIYDTDFHSMDHRKRNSDPEDRTDAVAKPVVIHKGAFIGAHATILKGVVVGENAIIGAGAVVTGHVPANEIWAGNPARFIRKTE